MDGSLSDKEHHCRFYHRGLEGSVFSIWAALEMVSLNGPQFVAREFQTFLKMNCIKHTLCPPFHPSTYGLAERHVRTFKRMYPVCPDKGSPQHKVANVLFR